MTAPEIRVLQEFRRLTTDSLPITAIQSIKHPADGGDAPAFSLVSKGFLTTDDAQQTFTLTAKAKEFLAPEPKPEFDGSAAK